MKLVVIDWVDSCGFTGWHREAPKDKAMLCRSVGWLTLDGKEVKYVAAHISHVGDPDETHQRDGEMCIPTVAIVKIEVLRDDPDLETP